MWDVLMAAVVFTGIAAIFKVIADAITRSKLINKGLVDENIKYLFTKDVNLHPVANVKWGLVLIGLGLALVLRQFFPYFVRDEAVLGLMFLFAGIGFLLYYFIASGTIKSQQRQNDA